MLNLTNEWLKTILILLYLGLLADSGLPGEALGGVTLLFYPNFFRGKLPPNKRPLRKKKKRGGQHQQNTT